MAARFAAVLATAIDVLFGLTIWSWLQGRPPSDDSAETGSARDMIVHAAQAIGQSRLSAWGLSATGA